MNIKPDLVLLPGMMCDAALWHQVGPLLGDTATLHHGNLFEDNTIGDMAARVLEEAPPQFALAGFSMGGYIAREIAMMAPRRVTRLALMNTSALGTSAAVLARNQRMIQVLDERPFTGLAPRTIRHALHPDLHGATDLTCHIQAMARRLGGDVFRRQMSLKRTDGHDRLGEILCPTLVISSDTDRLRPVNDSKRLAAGIPRARLEVISRCGHMTPLEQPEALARLLSSWLDETTTD